MNSSFSFLIHIKKNDNGCWIYNNDIAKNGYGRVSYKGIRHYAHRYSFRFFNNYLPDHLHVCHSCDTPKCVNPSHLWLGTDKDNMMDKANKGRCKNQNTYKTHCLNNHELAGDNLYIKPGAKSRHCRICIKHNRRNRYLKLGV